MMEMMNNLMDDIYVYILVLKIVNYVIMEYINNVQLDFKFIKLQIIVNRFVVIEF